MPRKKPAKKVSTTTKIPNVIMPDEEDEDIGDVTDDEAERAWNAAPPEIRAQIEKETDEQCADMIRQFDEHVRSLPKGAAIMDSRGRRAGFIPLDDLREIQNRDGLPRTKKLLEKGEVESEGEKFFIVSELLKVPSLEHIAVSIHEAEGKVTLDPWQEDAADICKHASRGKKAK